MKVLVNAKRERDLLASELRDGLSKSLGRRVCPADHHHNAVLPETEREADDKKRMPWMTEIGSDVSVLQRPCSFPRGGSRWEINTRLATPAQKRQGICHRTDDATILVIKWDMGKPGRGLD